MEQHEEEIKDKKLLKLAFLNGELGPAGHPWKHRAVSTRRFTLRVTQGKRKAGCCCPKACPYAICLLHTRDLEGICTYSRSSGTDFVCYDAIIDRDLKI